MDLVKRVQIDKAINTLGGKWPGLGKHDTLGHAAGIYFTFDGRSAPLPVLCTRAEFEARKAERQNKPSWDCGYRQIIQNGWGEWFGSNSKQPWHPCTKDWSLWAPLGVKGEVIGQWADTWEQRPNHIGESDEKGAAAGSTTSLNEYHAQVRQRFDAWADGVCAKLFPEPNIDFELTAFSVHQGLGGKMLLDKVRSIINEATTTGNSAGWYDYEKQQALRLPPVGIECEWSGNGGRNWHKTALIFLDETVFLTRGYQLYKTADDSVEFRPLDWDRNLQPNPEPEPSPELSFHLSNAFNELQASARLLSEDDPRRASIVSLAGGVSAVKEVV